MLPTFILYNQEVMGAGRILKDFYLCILVCECRTPVCGSPGARRGPTAACLMWKLNSSYRAPTGLPSPPPTSDSVSLATNSVNFFLNLSFLFQFLYYRCVSVCVSVCLCSHLDTYSHIL